MLDESRKGRLVDEEGTAGRKGLQMGKEQQGVKEGWWTRKEQPEGKAGG